MQDITGSRDKLERLSNCLCPAQSLRPGVRNIFVILGGLVFVLRAQTNSKHISSAEEFVTTNETQVPAKIVRIKLLDPFPKIRRKESAVLKVAIEPECTDIKLI